VQKVKTLSKETRELFGLWNLFTIREKYAKGERDNFGSFQRARKKVVGN